MFDINETIQSQLSGSVENHDRDGLEHYYINFANGYTLSILRGESSLTGDCYGNKDKGTVETAVLTRALGFLAFDPNEVHNSQLDLDSKGLLKEIERVAAL